MEPPRCSLTPIIIKLLKEFQLPIKPIYTNIQPKAIDLNDTVLIKFLEHYSLSSSEIRKSNNFSGICYLYTLMNYQKEFQWYLKEKEAIYRAKG